MRGSVPGLDHNRGAKRARECRTALGLEPEAPLDCLLTTVEGTGVHVVVGRLRDGVAGAYQRRGPVHLVFVDAASSLGRQRFTLAHELGHARMEHTETAIDTARTLSSQDWDPHEVQANAFAGELLAPRQAVRRLVTEDPDLEDVLTLAARFGLSALAALIRMCVAEVVSPEREARLRQEILDGHVKDLADHLALAWPEDRLAQLGNELPYVSPALRDSALGDLLTGACDLEEAARISNVKPDVLRGAAELLAAPTGAGAAPLER